MLADGVLGGIRIPLSSCNTTFGDLVSLLCVETVADAALPFLGAVDAGACVSLSVFLDEDGNERIGGMGSGVGIRGLILEEDCWKGIWFGFVSRVVVVSVEVLRRLGDNCLSPLLAYIAVLPIGVGCDV